MGGFEKNGIFIIRSVGFERGLCGICELVECGGNAQNIQAQRARPQSYVIPVPQLTLWSKSPKNSHLRIF